jgi:hypothetical protein
MKEYIVNKLNGWDEFGEECSLGSIKALVKKSIEEEKDVEFADFCYRKLKEIINTKRSVGS